MSDLRKLTNGIQFQLNGLDFHLTIISYKVDVDVSEIIEMVVRFVIIALLLIAFIEELKRWKNHFLPSAQFLLANGVKFLN